MQSELIPKQTQKTPEQTQSNSSQSSLGEMARNSHRVTEIAKVRSALNPLSSPENNTGIPDSLKEGVESLSGLSLNAVKVHRNSAKPSKLGANAITQDPEIHLGPGQEHTLPHETWHIVQQRQGRVAPTGVMDGLKVNTNPALENEADNLGQTAARLPAASVAANAIAPQPMLSPIRPGPVNIPVGSNPPPAQANGWMKLLGLAGTAAVTGYGAYAGSNYGEMQQIKSDPKHIPSGQRMKAFQQLQWAHQINPHSVATVAKSPLEGVLPYVGNWFSGGIGDHYEQESDALKQDWTEENLTNFGNKETKHWKEEETGLPRFFGSIPSDDWRANKLLSTKKRFEDPNM